MLKENKFMIYVKHLLLMSTVNKVRITLTAIGIFVAVTVFAIGFIATNSYYHKSLSVIDEIQKNTVAVNYKASESKQITEFVNRIGLAPADDVMLPEPKPILCKEIDGERYLNVMATLHGVNNLYVATPFALTEDSLYIPSQTQLTEGRLFTHSDIQEENHVAVIDEITALLLFPGESALGKTITVGSGINGSSVSHENNPDRQSLTLQVIGIVKSNSIMQERRLVLEKTLNETTDSLFFQSQIYCPIGLINEYYPEEEKEKHMIFTFDTQENYEQAVSLLSTLSETSTNSGLSFTYTTYEIQKSILEEDLQYTKIILNLITAFLCLISGISIMSITFFSIKERIPEIGVRKAFGATNIDIVFQFIFEMVSLAFLTATIATCFSILLSKALSVYLYENLYVVFPITLGAPYLLLPILIGVLEAVLCSIPPSLYAARIKVTDALRFE